MSEARDIYSDRIKRELIGPGSDIFVCSEDYSDEIIEGKPLTRYYSGILFPPKSEIIVNSPDLYSEDDDEINVEPEEIITKEKEVIKDENEITQFEEEETYKLTSNLYFPNNIGLTFCVNYNIQELDLNLSFGTYKESSANMIGIKYDGEGIELISKFNLQGLIDYDVTNKILFLKKKLEGKRKSNQKSGDYLILDSCLKNFASEISRDHTLLKHIKKLVYGKDKWQRIPHSYNIKIKIDKSCKYPLEDLVLGSNKLPRNLASGIFLYVKVLRDHPEEKKFIKLLLENKAAGIIAKKYIPTNEKLNESCLFQVEITIHSNKLVPFDKKSENKFISEEDRTLNFLYENVNSYGIGHGVASEWEPSDNPGWIKTSFFPHYDVKNQSTEFNIKDIYVEKILNIKNLSSFSQLSREDIIEGLKRFNDSYKKWIDEKVEENIIRSNKSIGVKNLNKCEVVFNRINNGIEILKDNDNAFTAFQFANSAMYLQMFHSARYFGNEHNKGYELFEWNERFQNEGIPKYEEYSTLSFPSDKTPKWRPFQLGFILLSLKSITEPTSEDRNLVDLVWFPTGGGKTEAYLSVTSFLIFYRRLTHKDNAYGVNAIIRYTLRLLTAQQFERASKIILSCEKIRRNNKRELGNEEISIGFWVGKETLPNKCKDDADKKYEKIMERLNRGEQAHNNFQINTCNGVIPKSLLNSSL